MSRTPPEIVELQHFGWGKFSDARIADKIDFIRRKMALRSPVSDAPRISVVVPAYNEDEYILGTLLSLSLQTHRDVEFIIVSNGEPFGNATQQIAQHAGFTVIHQTQKGWAKAHQAGLEIARGTIYATTDADTLHFPDWLTSVDNIFQNDGCIVATGPVQFLGLHTSKKIYRVVADVYKWLFEGDHVTQVVRGAWGSNSFFLRESLRDTGGYSNLSQHTWADAAVLHRVLPRGGEVRFNHPHGRVFSSARRMNTVPVRELIGKALRSRIGGIQSILEQEKDVR